MAAVCPRVFAAPAANPAPARAPVARPGVAPADTLAVRGMVRTLADPRWEGRGIGTAGIDSAARWIADRMYRAGLAPGGDSSSWYQPFEVTTGVVAEAPCALEAGAPPVQFRGALPAPRLSGHCTPP